MDNVARKVLHRRIPRKLLAVTWTVALAVVLAACTSAPAPAPTAAPAKAAEPTKAAAPAAPTSAPAAQPTAAPAKAAWPEKGKTITLVIPWDPGGINDIAARLLAPLVEKDLGVQIQVVNKPGAGSQIGLTEIAKAKPDGYTIGIVTLPTAITTYLDPERKAVYGRKDFQPLALHTIDPGSIAVRSDSPYKTTKDLVEAARANPDKIKAADVGILSGKHLSILDLQRITGIKFANVHFSGGAQVVTALMGGHVDAFFCTVSEVPSQVKNGEMRILGVMDKVSSKFYPNVTTMESQGYKVYSTSSRGWIAPTGTPKEVVDILSSALKRAMADDDHRKKLEESTSELRYMGPQEMAAYWDEMEATIKPLMDEAKKQ